MGWADFFNPFDDFGGGDKKGGDSGSGSVDIQSLMPSWQMGLGQDLSAWVRKFLQMYNPGEKYSGKLSVTDPSSYEKTGLDQLGTFLGKPATGDLFGAAKGQVMDTLGGRFADPATSPFIQAATKLAGQNLQDSINTARGQRGARGTYFTRSGIQEESRLSERTQNALNAVIGDFINQERGRQQNAVPQAQALEQYGEMTAPIQKINAAMTAGSLPRILEQADLEAQYKDYQRQRTELSQVPGVGNTLFAKNVPQLINSTAPGSSTPNMLAEILSGIDFGSILGGGSKGSSTIPSNTTALGGGGSSQFMDMIIKLLPVILAAA